MAESIRPSNPGGSSSFMSHGSALLLCPSSSEPKSQRATMPGTTSKKTMRILSHPARLHAPRAWKTFLAARTRCTIAWSRHQYQSAEALNPSIRPSVGKSASSGGLYMRKKPDHSSSVKSSSGGGVTIKLWKPPVRSRPMTSRKMQPARSTMDCATSVTITAPSPPHMV
eukprot:1153618-Pleurochrysis_carterae.AAC.2